MSGVNGSSYVPGRQPVSDPVDPAQGKKKGFKNYLPSLPEIFTSHGAKKIHERNILPVAVVSQVNTKSVVKSLEKQLIGQKDYKAKLEEKRGIASSIDSIKQTIQTTEYVKGGPQVTFQYKGGKTFSVIPSDPRLSDGELNKLRKLLSKQIGQFEEKFGNDPSEIDQKISRAEKGIVKTSQSLREHKPKSKALAYVPGKPSSYSIDTYLPPLPSPLPQMSEEVAQVNPTNPQESKDSVQNNAVLKPESLATKGFINLGNTCFANSGLKALIYGYPDSFFAMLDSLTLDENRDPIRKALLNLRHSLLSESNLTPNNTAQAYQEPLKALFGACFDYGITKDSQTFKFIFPKDPRIEGNAIIQHDVTEFINELMDVLQIKENYTGSILSTATMHHISTGDDVNVSIPVGSPDIDNILKIPLKEGQHLSLQTLITNKQNNRSELDLGSSIPSERWKEASYQKGNYQALESWIERRGIESLKGETSDQLFVDVKTFNILPVQLMSYAAGSGGTEGQSRKLSRETEALKAQLDRPLTISVIDKKSRQEKTITLRLKSFCLHIGGSDGGHYTAAVNHAKAGEKDQWWLHDDLIVGDIKSLPTVLGQPYLLFYEKVSE